MSGRLQRRRQSPKESERLRKHLAKYPAEYLRSIARRVMIDIVKGPVQITAYSDKALPHPPLKSGQGRGTATKAGGTGPKATRRPVAKRAPRKGKSRTARSRRKSTKS